MFESLSARLEGVFDRLRGKGKITEKDVADAMREVRQALLEADVNFKLVKQFVARRAGARASARRCWRASRRRSRSSASSMTSW